MIYGSVCSGIEAASLAFAPLGWRCAFLSEIDPFARAVLQYRYPDIKCHGDFQTIEDGMYEPIDLLVGGPPCQDFSVARLREGMTGARGNLTLEFIRLAGRLKPKYFLYENVPGILSSHGGRDFGAFLGALEDIGFGWAYRVLDAQFFRVPQRRRRVFVVGCAGDDRERAEQILFDGDGLRGDTPSRRTTGTDLAYCITSRFGSGRNDPTAETYIAGTLTASASGVSRTGNGEAEMLIAHTLSSHNVRSVCEDGTGRGSPLVPVAFSCKNDGQDVGTVSPTLRAMNHTGSHANAGGQVAVAFSLRTHDGEVQADVVRGGVAPTLRAVSGGSSHAFVAQRYGVRRLMPVECEKLQGLPPGWTDVPYRGKPAADGPRYKAIGNSMAVPVVAWLGRRIDQKEYAHAE
jgi:DNA (cytosine-5)-methyltransferase 1